MTAVVHSAEELVGVEEWRRAVLSDAGYPKELSVVMAACLDVDLHLAVEMVAKGCEPWLAARILL